MAFDMKFCGLPKGSEMWSMTHVVTWMANLFLPSWKNRSLQKVFTQKIWQNCRFENIDLTNKEKGFTVILYD